MIIKIAAAMKMTGHNLYGKKLILAPVKPLMIPSETNVTTDVTNIGPAKAVSDPILATIPTIKPMKIIDTPSTIHSIVMILRLSDEIAPKFLTTERVGIKCAIPQKINKNAAM
jgi:hypothetical protein